MEADASDHPRARPLRDLAVHVLSPLVAAGAGYLVYLLTQPATGPSARLAAWIGLSGFVAAIVATIALAVRPDA